ncbi:MAG TPA: hypothetical protein VMZ50_08300 [Phycisphaerae bacterium]|nr:hypothetical protein [Phycisphaerae bacterium]
MSDRSWVQMRYRAADRERVEREMEGFEQAEEDQGVVTGSGPGFDGGGSTDMEILARAGVPFVAYCGEGDNYGPMVTAACGGEIAAMDADHNLNPVVLFDTATGEPGPDALKNAREYAAVERRAEAALKVKPAGGEFPGAAFSREVRQVEASTFNKGAYEVVELFHVGCLGGRALVERDGDAFRCAGCHGTVADDDESAAILVGMALKGEA